MGITLGKPERNTEEKELKNLKELSSGQYGRE